MLAVAILLSLTMTWWEAAILAGLFITQLFFFDTTVRIGYGAAYSALAILVFLRDVALIPNFGSAVRETVAGLPRIGAAPHIDHGPPEPG